MIAFLRQCNLEADHPIIIFILIIEKYLFFETSVLSQMSGLFKHF